MIHGALLSPFTLIFILQRVEPSPQGGHKMACAFMDIITRGGLDEDQEIL